MNVVIYVLLTGKNSSNLRPVGYTYFDKNTKSIPLSDLDSKSDEADNAGLWFEYKEHYCSHQDEVRSIIEEIYGEIPTFYPQKKKNF